MFVIEFGDRQTDLRSPLCTLNSCFFLKLVMVLSTVIIHYENC